MQAHWLSNLCYAEIKHDRIHRLRHSLFLAFSAASLTLPQVKDYQNGQKNLTIHTQLCNTTFGVFFGAKRFYVVCGEPATSEIQVSPRPTMLVVFAEGRNWLFFKDSPGSCERPVASGTTTDNLGVTAAWLEQRNSPGEQSFIRLEQLFK